jgi:hypothetical protein
MKTTMHAIVGAVMLGVAALFVAPRAFCMSLSELLGNGPRQDLGTFKLIHVVDLKALIDSAKDRVHIFDANGPDTRARFGVIPGATLLNSVDSYDLSVLPSDKNAKLVFYCADTH